jgi:two-component system, cell cycle sensor histidine kinase and response regulator CckA
MSRDSSRPSSAVDALPDDALLRAIWDVAGDGIVVSDPNGRVIFWNAGAERLFGYTAEEMLGEPVTRLVPADERPVVGAVLDRLASGEKIRRYRAVRIHKDGSPVDVSVALARVRQSSGEHALVAVLRDISQRMRAEHALRLSEARFRALIEHASDLISILDRSGRIVYKSPATIRTLGYDPADLVGRSVFDFLHPDDRDATARTVRECIAKPRTPMPYFVRFRHADGHWVDLEGTCTSLLDDPAVGGLVANSRDVTTRRRAEAELRASEARYRQVFEGHQAIQLLLEPESGAIVEANSAAARFYGYSRAALERMRLWELDVLPEADARARLLAAVAEGEAFYHAPHQRQSGEVRTVEVRAGPVEVGGRSLLYCTIHDVTDRLEAEMAVRASEARLRLVLRRLPAVIWTTDRDLRLTSVEGSGLEALGIGREVLEGRLLEELMANEPEPMLSLEAHHRALAGETVHYETRFEGADFSCHVEPLLDSDRRLLGVMGVAFDVTERKRLEDQLRQAGKMEAIGRLAGGVAHDFNNLLTAVRGSVEFLLQDTAEDSPLRTDIHEISRAAERATELTRQLLAFGRRQVLKPQRLDLNRTVREMERMLRRVIGEDITLATELDEGVGVVEADPGQIGQVLMNLAINARDAMPAGGTLTISTSPVVLDERASRVTPHLAPGTPAALLVVRDSGVGMDAEVREHIFEPFFTTKGMGKGTGLGLATVYGIVKQSGGYISVDSAPDVGAAFSIYLPVVPGVPEEEPQSPRAAAAFGTGTVLLVEDEAAVLSIAERMLQRAGYRVVTARSGEEALVLAERLGEIDLLVTDVIMPGMNGRALADRLLAERPALRVLFMSGYTDDAIVQHGVLQHGIEFIQKPFAPGALVERVGRILEA